MKRALSLITAVFFLVTSASVAYAQPATLPSAQIKEVVYRPGTEYEIVDIAVEGYSDYSIMNIPDPDRIILDIFGTIAPGKQQIVQADGRIAEKIRYAQFDPNTARVVIDLNFEAMYGVSKTKTGLRIYLGEVPPPEGVTEEEEVSEGVEEETPELPGSIAISKKTTVNNNFSILYTPIPVGDQVEIFIKNYKGYDVFRLTGPDRLVLDIPNSKYAGADAKLDVNGTQVESIRYSQFSAKTSRIVFDLTNQSKFKIIEKSDRIIVQFDKPTYKNMIYANNGDRVYLNLKGAVLTSGDEVLKKLYTGKYSLSGKVYTITVPSGQSDLGAGKLRIMDDTLDSVEIKKYISGKTDIVITAKKKFAYVVFTRKETDDTNITIVKEAAKADKVVVIDAGHGGRMPGAVYKDIMEKDINLDIAKKLNALLIKKKVNTYMIRENDTHIANFERAYISNALNAGLYISIHNNAMDNSSFSGTMTLHFPQKANSKVFTGKTFAEILQTKLLATLGTVNRKTVERPNLVVLKAVRAPSAIAEIAYLTNSTDRNNLMKESFRQKAAQALCDSILKALEEI